MNRFAFFALVASIWLGTLHSQAHEVWLEDLPSGELAVRFAEYGEDFETSPGHLDDLSLPEGWACESDGIKQLRVEKAADHFAIKDSNAKTAVQVETVFKVIGGKPGGKRDEAGPSRRPFFYARWHVPGSGAGKPATNLDLVPTAQHGEFCLHFRGKPLAGVEVTAHFPDGAEETFVSDANGIVRVPTEQKGFYMLNVKRYREMIDGFVGGKPYNAVSHNCSVAWRQA